MVATNKSAGTLLNFEILWLSGSSAEWAVFIHGAGGSIKTWSYQTEAFKKHFNLLLIDLRDHGESKNIIPAYDRYCFELISHDIKSVIDHLKIRKAHFITLSFGSVVIQDFALRYSHLVDRIVMVGGIFKGNFPIRIFVYMARLMNHVLSYRMMYRLFSYLLMPRERHQLARRVYQMQARKLTQQEYLKWIGLYAEFFKLLKVFFRQVLEKPTLIVMGKDDYIFHKGAEAFIKKQPNARLVSMSGAGHICNIEHPNAFNEAALKFLTAGGSS